METFKTYFPWIITALVIAAIIMAIKNSKRIAALNQRPPVPLNSSKEVSPSNPPSNERTAEPNTD